MKVTQLEPRTLHQPEKLKKLSKNEFVFTPSIFKVNQNHALLTTRLFNRVHAVHNPMTENGAVLRFTFRKRSEKSGFLLRLSWQLRNFLHTAIELQMCKSCTSGVQHGF